jgi:hypothetical protein
MTYWLRKLGHSFLVSYGGKCVQMEFVIDIFESLAFFIFNHVHLIYFSYNYRDYSVKLYSII